MPMPGPSLRDSDEDFRLIHDETNNVYYIQKKRFFFGWKFLGFKFHKRKEALSKLTYLRREYKKMRIKKQWVILKD